MLWGKKCQYYHVFLVGNKLSNIEMYIILYFITSYLFAFYPLVYNKKSHPSKNTMQWCIEQ